MSEETNTSVIPDSIYDRADGDYDGILNLLNREIGIQTNREAALKREMAHMREQERAASKNATASLESASICHTGALTIMNSMERVLHESHQT